MRFLRVMSKIFPIELESPELEINPTHETITETIQKTEQKAKVDFVSITLTMFSMFTVVSIVRRNKRLTLCCRMDRLPPFC